MSRICLMGQESSKRTSSISNFAQFHCHDQRALFLFVSVPALKLWRVSLSHQLPAIQIRVQSHSFPFPPACCAAMIHVWRRCIPRPEDFASHLPVFNFPSPTSQQSSKSSVSDLKIKWEALATPVKLTKWNLRVQFTNSWLERSFTTEPKLLDKREPD